MLPSHKIRMAAYFVKNKIKIRRHLGSSHHFDFLAWQQCFYFNIALELQHIKKMRIMYSAVVL
jgi:predicted N-acyltransferase